MNSQELAEELNMLLLRVEFYMRVREWENAYNAITDAQYFTLACYRSHSMSSPMYYKLEEDLSDQEIVAQALAIFDT